MLASSLLGAPATWHAGEQPDALIAGATEPPGPDTAQGNRLTAEDAAGQEEAVHEHLLERYQSLDTTGKPGDAAPRLFDATPRSALRVPFLDALFEDAMFVYIHREPGEAIAEAMDLWRSEKAVTYPDLDGWSGPPWSLLLVPGWRELSGLPLEEVVVEQWTRSATILLDDLEALPPERWCVTAHHSLLAEPEDELQRIFRFLGIGWHTGCSAPMKQMAAKVQAEGKPQPRPVLADLLGRTEPIIERAGEWIAQAPGPGSRAPGRAPGEIESVDNGLGRLLKQLRSSLLVSTYQTNRLIALRWGNGALNAHLRTFDRPMGIAAHESGFALGVRAEVLDYRDFPAVAQGLEPKGSHDACYMPRNSHYTADIAIHDLGFAGGELWIVATMFSCLATLDMEHSFVPRWKPPFVSELSSEDRCHLNGLAIVDGTPRYVTALGVSNEPGGWRANKAHGGVIIEVPSGEVVVEGLSMPHSPRWYGGELFVLESGKGTLATCDPTTGEVETIAEMPGFTRGLAFSGNTAFVGLSQIRETATFGGLPIAKLDKRECGVWAIDIESGEHLGFVRFEDTVQELFDLELLPGVQFPDIAEPRSRVAESSWFLPRQL